MSTTDASSNRETEHEDDVQLLSGSRIYDRLIVGPLGEPESRPPVKRAALLVTLAWLPPAILSALAGKFVPSEVNPLTFMEDFTLHVRLLLGLPALILIEPFVRERLALVLRYLRRSDLIPGEERPRWVAAMRSTRRRCDSVVAEVMLLALALAISLWGTFSAANDLHADLRMGAWRWTDPSTPSPAGWWYVVVSGPILLGHVLRWFYRLGLWTNLLRTLSALRLRLRPAHPDLAGGLGILSTSQASFALFFAALSIMSAGSLAYEILFAGHSVLEYRVLIGTFTFVSLVVLFGPLALFAHRALLAREVAYSEYAAAANLMFTEYESKWIGGVWKGDPSGNMDPSTMTDYSQVFDNIRRMRTLPVEPMSVIVAALLILLPYVPLVFTAMSLEQLLQRVAKVVL